VETVALTREELVELVEVIASEVAREIGRLPVAEPRRTAKAESCSFEMCPHNPAPAVVEARAISMTAELRVLAGLIDHTLLRPEATRLQVERLCAEARLLGFATVCVNPVWVPLAAEQVRDSPVKVATVAGFPFGATPTSAKRLEAQGAIRAGAQEIDMVMNVGAMKSGQPQRVHDDIRGVAEICRSGGAALKVILENAYLSEEEKVAACRMAQSAGADYVKTSTGFGPSGATEDDVRLMRETVGPAMGVKAAGGIRTLADALRMLQAGASRLGASASVAILAEAAHLAKPSS
jgi:deoxyribose-phosphate aldolase